MNRRELLAGLLATGAAGCVPTDDTALTDTDYDGPWATGGTAAMTGDYEAPFDDDCLPLCAMTLGPCYGPSIEDQDISEGVDGLPMRMALRVVDADCEPVAGAVVDVWHCAPSGRYSGDQGAAMCNELDPEAMAAGWFRGTATTDDDGVVCYDSCLPGWYGGRCVHVHLQVRIGEETWLTSQLAFDEALLAEVMSEHPAYAGRGTPDTDNAEDGIMAAHDDHLFSWERSPDGVLIVWRTLALPEDPSDPSC